MSLIWIFALVPALLLVSYFLAILAVSFRYGDWRSKLALFSVAALLFSTIGLQSVLNQRLAHHLSPDTMLGLMMVDSICIGLAFIVLYRANWH